MYFDYYELISRNSGFISDELQDNIKHTRLAFFGVGLCSSITENCVKIGFENIHIQDGDIVELTNLNRQAFTCQDVDCYKVDVIAKRLKAINPECHLSVNNCYVKSVDEIKHIIDKSDVIINTIDCNQVYFDMIEYGRTQGKLVLCPFNIGFGGFILSFAHDSSNCWKVFDRNKELNNTEVALQLFKKYSNIKMLKQLNCTPEEYSKKVQETCFAPQINIGASVASAMLLTILIKYLKGESFPLAPDAYCIDLSE